MKKIITAAAIAAMAASFAAAEVSVKMNYRTRASAFDYTKTDNGTNTTEKTNWFDLDGYAASQDNINFVASSDKAGVQLQFMPTATTANNAGWRINTYNAWMKFGDLKLAAGVWKDGVADGSYRVKKDHDAGNYEGIDSERFKLGSAFKSMPSTFVDNVVSQNGGDNQLSAYAEYPLALNDDMSLNLLASAVSNTYDTVNDDSSNGDKDSTVYNTGLAARVQFNMKGLFNSEVIFKQPNRSANVVALYVQPKLIDNLDLAVGGAVELISKSTAFNYADDMTNWSIDLRARYAVNNQLSVYTFNKISATDLDAGLQVASGIAGVDGKAGYFGNSSNRAKSVMWNMIGARYKINDLATAYLNGGLLTALENAKHDDNSYLEWRVTPGIQLYAASNASINIGCAISGANIDVDGGDNITAFSVAVPVIFRVKM